MKLEAYLFFPGTTAAAAQFYKDVFGGELTITKRGDVDPTATDAEKEQVINALLEAPGFRLRANDRADVTTAAQNRIALTLIGSDEPGLTRIYEALSAEGTIDSPLEKQFWGDTFGTLTDKYGISWQVNIEATPA